MRDYQQTALSLAEEILAGNRRAKTRLDQLCRAFRAAFLNYTPETPNHWRHPRNTWGTFPDLPSQGSCVMLVICAAKHCGYDTGKWDELVYAYHQFLGAMSKSLSAEERVYACYGTTAAACLYDDPHFALLAKEWDPGTYVPESRDGQRAKAVLEKIQSHPL